MATNYNFASYVQANNPTLRGTDELGKLYGITYDQAAIEGILNKATDAEYKVKENEMTKAENQYAINQFNTQNSTVEALRKNRANQISSGASRGIQAASDAGAVLGLQREGVAGATDLANQRVALGDEMSAAYANNVVKALQESNSVKQALAGIDSSLYGSDMLGYTGQLNYNSTLDTNQSNRYGADVTAQATRDAAATSANATIRAAQISAAATQAAAAAGAKTTDTNGDQVDFQAIFNKYPNNKNAFLSYVSGVTGGMSADMLKVYGDMYDTFKTSASQPSVLTKQATPNLNLNTLSVSDAIKYWNK